VPALLPEISATEFRDALEEVLSAPIPERLAAMLFAHYEELRRWAARTALIGAGDTERMVERHYAESLMARSLVAGADRILDLGTGAGFPGWVLAAALPAATVWLVESRQRKVAFLRSAAARAQLSCRVVDARVSRRQPVTSLRGPEGEEVGAIDLVTVRAVKLTEDLWGGLARSLAAGARVLRWEGTEDVAPVPGAIAGRTVRLPAGKRRIQEWLVTAPGRDG